MLSRKKARNLAAVVFIGLFFMSREPVFLWFFVGALVLLQADSDSSADRGKKQSWILKAKRDGRRHSLSWPKSRHLRSLLGQVYQNHAQAVSTYPHLKQDYDEVLDKMWVSLAKDSSPEHWTQIIGSVLSGWPQAQPKSEGGLHAQLQKVRELSRQWDEAKSEALGGACV